MFGASSELASVMEFGFNRALCAREQLCLFVKLSCFALFMTTPLIYLAFGFVDIQPTIIGLVLISGYIMTPFHVVSRTLHLHRGRRLVGKMR